MRSPLSPVVFVAVVVASTIAAVGDEQTRPVPPIGHEFRITEGGEAPNPTNSRPKDLADWRQLVVEELVRQRRFPPGSARRNEHGVATVWFKVDRTGKVIEQKLVKTSGFFALDLEAMELVKRAQLPPFAATMTESELELSVPINFAAGAPSKPPEQVDPLHSVLAASAAFLISAVLLALVFILA